MKSSLMSSVSRRIAAGVVLCIAGLSTSIVFAFPVDVSEAPGNTLALTVSAIKSAKRSILLNIYEMSSPEIAEALKGRIEAGLHVEILEEGQPVGGMSAASREIQAELVEAMKQYGRDDHFYEMTSKAGGQRRFRFNHAKYVVIDGAALLIGSENYSATGNPTPSKLGNRGWEVLIHEPKLAKSFRQMFEMDRDLSHNDVIDRVVEPFVSADLAVAVDAGGKDSHNGKRNPLYRKPRRLEASSVVEITSPDISLSGLVSLLSQAESSVDIQVMTFDSNWGKGDREGNSSPLLAAVLGAARRGVSVRVLLNDETVFFRRREVGKFLDLRATPLKNRVTVELLNSVGKREKLKLSAHIADVKAMDVDYIHNKGVLIDDDKTLISSINWNENSVERNREAAVVLVSPQIHDHYEALFETDWQASTGKSVEDLPALFFSPFEYLLGGFYRGAFGDI